MQRIKSTHQGHCQVCGRIQAVQRPVRTLAKHGYTVKGFGYFSGTCAGSDHLPMEQERSLTNTTLVCLKNYADQQTQMAAEFEAGTRLPRQAWSGKYARVTTRGYSHSEREMVDFAVAPALYQREAVQVCVSEAQSQARHASAHAASLRKLAEVVHGAELILIAKEPKVAPVRPTVDVAAGVVSGTYVTKQARQDDLDSLNRQYEKAVNAIQDVYLALPRETRTEEQTKVYYGPGHLSHWRPKHSEAVLKVFPECAALVTEIEQLVKTREAVRKA